MDLIAALSKLPSTKVDKPDTMQYDLGDLVSYDSTPVDTSKLRGQTEKYIKDLARDNLQLLFNHIFSLPNQLVPGEAARLTDLPKPTTPHPREKPVPKPRPPTKWELFAKKKGIQKRKKGRMVFDEEKQEYAPRWGYQRANDETQQWVVDHKPGDDLSVDPFTKLKQEKKERVRKNEARHRANLDAASGYRAPGAIDLSSARKSAIEATGSMGKRNQQGKQKSKHHVDVALETVQHSTASMGRFDKKRDREPTIKPLKERKAHAKNATEEREQSLKVLNKVMGSMGEDSVNFTKAANLHMAQEQKARSKSKTPTGKGGKGGPHKGGKGGAKGGKGRGPPAKRARKA